ncbi:hypothetical protein [Actinoallomurus sp. CA-150999]|uniref:hypothetical protein n=1 Tax=Actinoallomurus sp. CA-150999 TaxID=3239887 RepID=UPI003D8EDC0F
MTEIPNLKIKTSALRGYAKELDSEHDVWENQIKPSLLSGDTSLNSEAFTGLPVGGTLAGLYTSILNEYSQHVAALSWELLQAKFALQRAADTYGKAESIIADSLKKE